MSAEPNVPRGAEAFAAENAAASGNLERFSGFAHDYQRIRPAPPGALRPLLLALANTQSPGLVVDIGSGTGLSTRFWAHTAGRVVGVEPNDDMRSQAASATVEPNVEYIKGVSTSIPLASGGADIATCSQALHWMEPGPTFIEVARILKRGGVFAAYDYDWPPTTGVWEADQAYVACMERLALLESRESEKALVHRWDKDGHLQRMKASGCFRFTKEVTLHHVETGDHTRFFGTLMSQGGVRMLLRAGYTEHELGIDVFRTQCEALLGAAKREWYWSSRVRIGIT